MNTQLIYEMTQCMHKQNGILKWCYPKWVKQGKCTEEQAEREQYLMEQVEALLKAIYNGDMPSEVKAKLQDFGEG